MPNWEFGRALEVGVLLSVLGSLCVATVTGNEVMTEPGAGPVPSLSAVPASLSAGSAIVPPPAAASLPSAPTCLRLNNLKMLFLKDIYTHTAVCAVPKAKGTGSEDAIIELGDLVNMEAWRSKVLREARPKTSGGTVVAPHPQSATPKSVTVTPLTTAVDTASVTVVTAASTARRRDPPSGAADSAILSGSVSRDLPRSHEKDGDPNASRDLTPIPVPLASSASLSARNLSALCPVEPNTCQVTPAFVAVDDVVVRSNQPGSTSDLSESSSIEVEGEKSVGQVDDDLGDESSAVRVSTSASGRSSTKTIKQRFNYASQECGAKILRHNDKATGASSVLNPGRDTYMLNPCETDHKFIIIELCEEIGVTSIELANYELFSSNFQKFGVYVSDSYSEDAGDEIWTHVADFTADNRRELQVFEFEQQTADFLKIEFYTHYGDEFYCPLSVVQVYGSNLVEELKAQLGNDENEVLAIDEAASHQSRQHTSTVAVDVATEVDPGEAVMLDEILSDILASEESTTASPPADVRGKQNVSNPVNASAADDRPPADLTHVDETSGDSAGWKGVLSRTSGLVKSLEQSEENAVHEIRRIDDESHRAHVQELIESQQHHDRSQHKTQNVFVRLAERVKQLEINQSLAVRYLEDVTARSLLIFKDAKESLTRIKQEHKALSHAIHEAATHGAAMQSRFEGEMAAMIRDGIHSATQNMTAQLMFIQQSHRESVLALVGSSQIQFAVMFLSGLFFAVILMHIWVTKRVLPRHSEKAKSDLLEMLSLRLQFELQHEMDQKQAESAAWLQQQLDNFKVKRKSPALRKSSGNSPQRNRHSNHQKKPKPIVRAQTISHTGESETHQ